MHLLSTSRYAFLGLISTLVLTVKGHPYDSSSALALASVNVVPRATVCNGHAELCDRGFGNVTFVGAHDSYAIGVNNGTYSMVLHATPSNYIPISDSLMMVILSGDESGPNEWVHSNRGFEERRLTFVK